MTSSTEVAPTPTIDETPSTGFQIAVNDIGSEEDFLAASKRASQAELRAAEDRTRQQGRGNRRLRGARLCMEGDQGLQCVQLSQGMAGVARLAQHILTVLFRARDGQRQDDFVGFGHGVGNEGMGRGACSASGGARD